MKLETCLLPTGTGRDMLDPHWHWTYARLRYVDLAVEVHFLVHHKTRGSAQVLNGSQWSLRAAPIAELTPGEEAHNAPESREVQAVEQEEVRLSGPGPNMSKVGLAHSYSHLWIMVLCGLNWGISSPTNAKPYVIYPCNTCSGTRSV